MNDLEKWLYSFASYVISYKADIAMFSKNRKLFIEGMEKDGLSTFVSVQNKRFNVFDEEMAQVTAKSFNQYGNAEKSPLLIL